MIVEHRTLMASSGVRESEAGISYGFWIENKNGIDSLWRKKKNNLLNIDI